ncbi:alpha/beta fold hydrolase [Mucilaginibacter conchicola]|uniref:Alpha/beta fold hydrolase n=1 Tax=Mucilaginibacter conchicola TaxID=2303333 RepID=A0A372P006_9SPHI|nr:alpha/beta fold hydrolase [Mucilaginibacter conchicola]RFZ95501.1 alpha/beta fold hydrolase [Mucilaginibacter conchicola]
MILTEQYTIPGAKGRPITADLTYDDIDPRAPLVIFAHGVRGFKDWGAHHLVARHFAENGFRFLKFNFSHNGTTPEHLTEFADLIAFGDNTFSIELDDLKNVIDFACSGSAIPAADGVYLIGHSLGGGVSVVKTAEDNRVKKLVTMAAIANFDKLWPKQIEDQWRLQGVIYMKNARTGQDMPYRVTMLEDLDKNPIRLNIQRRAAEISQPWLIVHGDADASVPLQHAELLNAANLNAKLLVVQGADHVFNVSQPYLENTLSKELQEFADAAIAFFQR